MQRRFEIIEFGSFSEQRADLVRLQVNWINLTRIVNDRVESSNTF